MVLGLFMALVVIFLDQLSKMLVFQYLTGIGQHIEVTSFFNLVSAWNTGVSFSMFNNLGNAGIYILSGFSLVVVGFLFHFQA